MLKFMNNTKFIFLKDFTDKSLKLTNDEKKFKVEKSAKLVWYNQCNDVT